ncbi:hypothetical protein J0X19_12305 [Hymenobacter sp. BT186]|uniref:Uncharacterized protein n=1 Tax=Hymenobacter telluris TaxID=2816474 RepID=A0A939EY33_9BACT|nr:hypothetical protein [Hymenobacter telluris]MBW3374758.1 hypothetical protein [Hymenobacter norwichensis]
MKLPDFLLTALALLAVVAVRLHGLAEAALPDYDSVRNWQIVQEVAHGNLRNLFHHGSPAFSVVYAPVAWLTTDYRVYQHLNALLAVVALAWLVQFIGQTLRLTPLEKALLLLFAGTSVFLTFSGRDFTMGSMSLWVFVGLIRAHYQRLRRPSEWALLRVAAWLALGLSVNYKFLLTVPVLLVLELLWGRGLLWRPATFGRVLLVLAGPYVVFGLLGMLGELPWYRWPAVYYNLVFPGASNAAGRAGHFRFDGLYYLRYLWDFESPLLLPGLLGGLLLALWGGWPRLKQERRQPGLAAYLSVWAGCFLLGMSLLLKAPRGLLLVYPLFYVLAFLVVRRLLRNTGPVVAAAGITVGFLAATAFNLHRIQREIYAYAPTRYGQLAQQLRRLAPGQPIGIASTMSLGLRPFLTETDTLAVITTETQLPQWRRQQFNYVLLDASWRVVNSPYFDSLARQQPLLALPEPLLTSPLLFLEHSEYTGLGYQETLILQQAARRDSLQLRLYRLR